MKSADSGELPKVMDAAALNRILGIANKLFEEGGGKRNPRVSDVRRAAGVAQDFAMEAMKTWRRGRSLPLVSADSDLPEPVKNAFDGALRLLMASADEVRRHDIQGERLRWQSERDIYEGLLKEVGEDLECERERGDAIQRVVADLELSLKAAKQASVEAKQTSDQEGRAASEASLRAVEIERRADVLSQELARAHAERAHDRDRHAAALSQIRQDRAEDRTRRDSAMQSLNAKCEEDRATLIRRIDEERSQRTAAREDTRAARQEATSARQEAVRARKEATHVRKDLIAIRRRAAEYKEAAEARQVALDALTQVVTFEWKLNSHRSASKPITNLNQAAEILENETPSLDPPGFHGPI